MIPNASARNNTLHIDRFCVLTSLYIFYILCPTFFLFFPNLFVFILVQKQLAGHLEERANMKLLIEIYYKCIGLKILLLKPTEKIQTVLVSSLCSLLLQLKYLYFSNNLSL